MPRTERIIDSDAHVFEPQDIWLRYLDAPLREVVTSIPGLENGNSTGNDGPTSRFPLGFIPETGRQDLLQLAANAETRLKVMDDEGIDSVALFPHTRFVLAVSATLSSRRRYFALITIGWPNIARRIKRDCWELR